MPYWFESEKLKIPRAKDKRVKLTDEDKADIKEAYKAGWPIRKIAREFDHVSRRMIQFVLFPERLEKARTNYDWKNYYNTERRAGEVRKYRHHKKDIFGLRVDTANKAKSTKGLDTA